MPDTPSPLRAASDTAPPDLQRVLTRVQRLEETLAFSDHAGDALSHDLTALAARVQSLSHRLELLERRVEATLLATEPRLEPASASSEPPGADEQPIASPRRSGE